MAYIPPTTTGLDPWSAYREKYGPVSKHEEHVGVEKATCVMQLLDKFNNLGKEEFALNERGDIVLVDVGDKVASQEQLNTIQAKAQAIMDHLYETAISLPQKAHTVQEAHALVDKEIKLRSLQGDVDFAFRRSAFHELELNLLPKNFEFKNYHATIARTRWSYAGDTLDVKVQASFQCNPYGRILKIVLKANQELASAVFQRNGDVLEVRYLTNNLESEPVTGNNPFITLIIQIVFNVWEKDPSQTLEIYLKQEYFNDSQLGIKADLERSGDYEQPIRLKREDVHFNTYENILNLNRSIVPKL